MELLTQKRYALTGIYQVLCCNTNPSETTRRVIDALEERLLELSNEIDQWEEPKQAKTTTNEIPY